MEKNTNEYGKKYFKIVLTGGPCAGKTTAKKLLADKILAEYGNEWSVFTVFETVSLLFTGRILRTKMNEKQRDQWQEDVLKTIIQLEKVYENIAKCEKKKSTIIICDRGAMDPKVFTKPEQWFKILKKIGITESDILSRYKYVFQMEIAPMEYYNQISNVGRRETYEEALKINDNYRKIWNKHESFKEIKNPLNNDSVNLTESWNKKFDILYSNIKMILETD